jgi:hypothetical protein
MTVSIAIEPNATFTEVVRALAAIGWHLNGQEDSLPPLVSGEPELASWHHREFPTRITQTFNPVVRMRVLAFDGDKAQALCNEATGHLPILRPKDVEDLLSSDDQRQILLGVFVLKELELFELMPKLSELQHHHETLVANAARNAQRLLSAQLLQSGLTHLAQKQIQTPDRSVLFPYVGTVQERRQILRWLAHDHDRANDDIIKILRSALHDDDWEIRSTVMLVAARLGASDLALDIRRMALPQSSREGLNREVRGLLVALRKAALATLGGEQPGLSARPVATPVDRQSMWNHLLACVRGEPVPLDRASLVVRALTEPLDIPDDMPVNVPDSIETRDGVYAFGGTDIELCWVAAIPHLLGHADEAGSADRTRMQSPHSGFFITTTPITRLQHAALLGTTCDDDQDGDEFRVTQWQSAAALAVEVSARSGASVSLPTSDQWEMAARGPDGRRHPWGNGLEPNWENMPSPWGLKYLFSAGPEWVISRDGRPHLAGADRSRICSVFERDPDPDSRAVFRLVVNID